MITAETIAAYADGELDAEVRAEVEAALASDAALRTAFEREANLRARLSARFDAIAEEPVPDRLQALLRPASNVLSLAQAREQRKARWGWPQGIAIAASLAVGLVLGRMALSEDTSGLATRDGMVVASGPIAAALETQLASAQPTGAAVRIGISFRDRAGAACRSFTTAQVAGLACRSSESWQIAAIEARSISRLGDYRQVGSADAAMLALAQAMAAGEPLDAAREREARNQGWKPLRSVQ